MAMIKKVNPKSYVTNESLKEALSDVVEIILEGMDKLFGELKNDIHEINNDTTNIKRQINDLKVDTPTQKEFNELKDKVDKYLPLT